MLKAGQRGCLGVQVVGAGRGTLVLFICDTDTLLGPRACSAPILVQKEE